MKAMFLAILTLSITGIIMAKLNHDATALAKELPKHGIAYEGKSATRGLGAGFSFGNISQKRHLLKNRIKVAEGPLKKWRESPTSPQEPESFSQELDIPSRHGDSSFLA